MQTPEISGSSPLYRHVSDALRQRIAAGEIAADARALSERRLAEEYGVSRMTARHALAVLADEGIIERRPSSGTYVREPSGARDTISQIRFVSPWSREALSQSNFYFRIFSGAVEAAEARGWGTAFSSLRDGAGILRDIGDNEAVILAGLLDEAVPQALAARGVPFCLVDCASAGQGLACGAVEVDSFGGACAIVEALVAAGHRRIAFVTPAPETGAFHARYNGYVQTLRQHGIPVRPEDIHRADWSDLHADLVRIARRLCERATPPTAVFATDDSFALPLLGALASLGVRVPEDVSLAGFGDSESASLSFPRLASVKLNEIELGRTAVRLLEQRPGSRDAEATMVVVPAEVILRESVGPPPAREKGTP